MHCLDVQVAKELASAYKTPSSHTCGRLLCVTAAASMHSTAAGTTPAYHKRGRDCGQNLQQCDELGSRRTEASMWSRGGVDGGEGGWGGGGGQGEFAVQQIMLMHNEFL